MANGVAAAWSVICAVWGMTLATAWCVAATPPLPHVVGTITQAGQDAGGEVPADQKAVQEAESRSLQSPQPSTPAAPPAGSEASTSADHSTQSGAPGGAADVGTPVSAETEQGGESTGGEENKGAAVEPADPGGDDGAPSTANSTEQSAAQEATAGRESVSQQPSASAQPTAPISQSRDEAGPNEPSDVGPGNTSPGQPAGATDSASGEANAAEPNPESESASGGDSEESVSVPTAPRGDAQPARSDRPQRVWLNDIRTNILFGVVLISLAIASLVGRYLSKQPSESVNPALVRRFRQRVNAWWLMCAIIVFGMLLQPLGTVVLFGLISFWAMREFITMAPTRRGDHRALFWALIVFTPLQYVLVGLEYLGLRWPDGRPIDFYGLYSIMIPVYVSLFIPARIALAGDHKRFLERSAQITVGMLICVYALSYAPALINLKLVTSSGQPWQGSSAGLLFFLILISQLSDILQWGWGHLVGRRVIAPEISPSRTWEGFAGGTFSTGLIGAALFWVTPFAFWEAACMSMIIAVMGMFGGMTMSAIKRDRGVSDYGSLVIGHAGVLDRIDTLCFAAPVFFHITRFFFAA